MWPAEGWGLGGLGWGGTHHAIRTQPRPDARRLPASAATHRPLCARILTFPSGPRLTSLSPRACLSTARSIYLSPRRSLVAVSTVLLLLHTRHPPTRTVGQCEIPVDTEVLVSCGFQRGDRVSTPRSGRLSIRGIPPVNHNLWKVGVVIGHSSTFSLFKPRPQLTSDGQ